jgi:antitoxin FitA
MASLSVRKLDSETLNALRLQAARHGLSMEEEVRQILKRSVQGQQSIGLIALNLFGPKQGIDLKLSRHSAHQPLDLDE